MAETPPNGLHPGVVRWYGPPGSWVGKDSGLHCPVSDLSKGAIIRFDLTGKVTQEGPWTGKSADEVSASLGTPIKERVQRATVYWEYTRSDGNYHRRWVGFDHSGTVVEKVAFFWWD